MSGFRGTFGSDRTDKVASWIYDHIEGTEYQKAVTKMIQAIIKDREMMLTIPDRKFRDRVAEIFRRAHSESITMWIQLTAVCDPGHAGNGSGFLDLPTEERACPDPRHDPPGHMVIPQGKGYRHVCPACGRVQEIRPVQIRH